MRLSSRSDEKRQHTDLLTAETDDEFEAAFEMVLDSAIRHLEKNKTNFQKLDEVGLSGVLAGSLSIPGLTVTQESHSNGHVDLTIEADHCLPARIKLGEAKVYDGPAYHVKGLEQLLGRYTTGREGRGLIISYVRQRDIRAIINKLRLHMDEALPLSQTCACEDHRIRWSFVTVHLHSCGENLQVGHIGICTCHLNSLLSGTPREKVAKPHSWGAITTASELTESIRQWWRELRSRWLTNARFASAARLACK